MRVEKTGVVQLSPGGSHLFARGDIVNDGQMVLRVDHERSQITVGKATWWRRARVWLRAKALDSWRWTACTVADGWEWLTREDVP